jgi:hypothetical protein
MAIRNALSVRLKGLVVAKSLRREILSGQVSEIPCRFRRSVQHLHAVYVPHKPLKYATYSSIRGDHS